MQALHRRRIPHGRVVALLAIVVVAMLGTGVAYAATRPAKGTAKLQSMLSVTHANGPVIAVPTTLAGSWPTQMTGEATTPTTTKAKVAQPTTSPASSATTATTATPAPGSPGGTPLTYTVKPGDTLSTIAAWFKLNGYQGLYQANWQIIGSDPNLIRPGQVITIADGQMTVG